MRFGVRAVCRRVTVGLLAIVMCAAAMSATACAPPDSQFDYLRLQVDGQATLAISKKDVLVRGIVVFFHGTDQNEFSVTSSQPYQAMTEKLVDAGFAVVSSMAGGNAFTEPATLQNYRELGSMAMQHYRIENTYFLADSMGAIPAMNLLASGYSFVRGVVAINPALNFASATPDWPALPAHVSNGAVPPMVSPVDLPLDSMHGRNLRFYASPDDKLVSADANAIAFERRFGSVANVSVVKCSGGQGDSSCGQGDDVAKWFTEMDQGPNS
jgi:hypothetical protein